MNQMRLVPKKDYVANRLVSGALQLARNTSLLLDETQLEQGQLDTTGEASRNQEGALQRVNEWRLLLRFDGADTDRVGSSSLCSCGVGVRNVTALGNLISWQKVDYDFNYHQMEFPCNINVLIASEGRSLLPVRTDRDEACFPPPYPSPPSLFTTRKGSGFLPSRVRCWRLFPAGVALQLASCSKTSSQPLSPRSHCVASSPKNVLCAIPVCWPNGLLWRQLCATGTILGEASGLAIYKSHHQGQRTVNNSQG